MLTLVVVLMLIGSLYPWFKGWWFIPAVVTLVGLPFAGVLLYSGMAQGFLIATGLTVAAWVPLAVRSVFHSPDAPFQEPIQISINR